MSGPGGGELGHGKAYDSSEVEVDHDPSAVAKGDLDRDRDGTDNSGMISHGGLPTRETSGSDPRTASAHAVGRRANDFPESPDSQQIPDEADGHDGTSEWSRGWRSVFLLAVTIFLVVMGLLFRSASQGGQEPSALENPQQILNVYTTDPNATVHLNVEVFWQPDDYLPVPYADAYLNLSGPGIRPSTMIMIVSSLQASYSPVVPNKHNYVFENSAYRKMKVLPGMSGVTVESPEYVYEVAASDLQDNVGDPLGTLIGSFELPGAVSESHGSYFAHLPTLGLGEGEFQFFPTYLTERDLATGIDSVIEYPRLVGRGGSDPAVYKSFSTPISLYWQPSQLNTSETLWDAEPLFVNTNAENVQPSNGILESSNYSWQETGSIDPVIHATEDSAASAQDAWTFRSGIAFGIAAGTGVAFFQEDENPILRRSAGLCRSLWRRPRKRPRREAA